MSNHNKDLNIYVLVKQVPDTRSKAGVNPDGTIDRAKAGKMLNPFDSFAMEAALNAKRMGGAGSKVTAVSMGPPPAIDILYKALEHGVDKTCLLSDRKLAASDTLATAYALSMTLQYLFKRDGKPDLVFCGLQTTDGDTAQVGPEICERLDLTQVTYVEDFKIENNLVHARKVIEGGAMEVEAQLPALMTIANSYKRLQYKTFRGAKFAQEVKRNPDLQKEFVEIIDLATIGADDMKCGLPGSPTIVSMTWKIGVVGGNCEMHQGKAVSELVSELVSKEQELIREFVLS
jgi:electron transfer flavoprotein beta subunit